MAAARWGLDSVDPSGEWLAPVAVLQPEAMWAAQLERSKDVVAQVQTIV